ncbi:MAG: DUF1801 domain-containing protein [Clostridiales bacterium]|nr:DUF1801 domain-containing protein [Clostridiales bacterium]
MWKCEECRREFKNNNQSHSCGKAPANVDEYNAAQAEELRPLLNRVRETIRAAAPNAVEKIAWGMPTYWQGENIIHFAAFQKHLGIYPGDLSLAPFEDRLAGYRRTKGAVQFAYDEPIDYALIAELARWRVFCVTSGDP